MSRPRMKPATINMTVEYITSMAPGVPEMPLSAAL